MLQRERPLARALELDHVGAGPGAPAEVVDQRPHVRAAPALDIEAEERQGQGGDHLAHAPVGH